LWAGPIVYGKWGGESISRLSARFSIYIYHYLLLRCLGGGEHVAIVEGLPPRHESTSHTTEDTATA
jgi:hypothetical protein